MGSRDARWGYVLKDSNYLILIRALEELLAVCTKLKLFLTYMKLQAFCYAR